MINAENEQAPGEPAPSSKKSSPAMDFVIAQLQKNPAVEYKEVKEAADHKELAVYPIMYGRAKALLGLVEVAPRGSGKKAREAREARDRQVVEADTPRRTPKRNRDAHPLDSLESMIANVREVQEERNRYRAALAKIAEIIEAAL